MANPDISSSVTSDGKPPSVGKDNWPPTAVELKNGKLYDAAGKVVATTDGKAAAPEVDKSNWPPQAVELKNGKLYDADGKALLSPKQIAINTQKSYLQGSMKILSATSGITGLSDLLTFDN
jgi:hypothetical protein